MTYYERRLPHWHPEGAALFVTWRLHGSLPKGVRPSDTALPAGKAFAAADRYLDQASTGPLWLRDARIAECVVEALRYGERLLGLYALHVWVVMANHVHVLLQPRVAAARITGSVKNFTARKANEILGRRGQPFWQDESYDHWVRNRKEFERIVAYIESNPVRAGLVERVEDWPWSSASARFAAGREPCPTPLNSSGEKSTG